ncbi:DHH family phosphoesterase [Mycoplasmopsis lipofaciens]|uniref:DHH family phosphoesterase n=1 Tax=Mycoplasmopsis lipofaciens TaxID=114884 RepID=UPI000486D3E8|nr:bifunctional oligoribonuclease/PAP phosphatase NrnA [Mycoplasmopsis lipofaciens]
MLKNNNDIKKLLHDFWELISQHQYITLCTHIEPDGDTLGSAVALKNLIELNCQKVKEVKISGGDYPRNLNFLDKYNISLVDDEFFQKSLKVVVDTSTVHRIFDERVVPKESVKIDHHGFENQWMFEIGGDYWPATGQLIVLLIKYLNLKVNNEVLEAAAVAIITDTEYFRERNISDETFECMSYLMKLGLNYANLLTKMSLNFDENQKIFNMCNKAIIKNNVTYLITDEIIENDIARPLVAKFTEISNTEVQLALLKKDNQTYRGELRSKTYFDVSKVAIHFGGGGHHNSAGFTLTDISKVDEVLTYISKLLK